MLDDEHVETGLEAFAEPDKDAAKALLAMPEMTQTQLASFARELAMDIKTHSQILALYNLTAPQYAYLLEHNEFFKHALRALTIEWQSAKSTPERIKIEAAAALEDALPRLSARMVNQAEGLPGVTEVAKLFAKIAGVGERDQAAGTPGEKFTITINLGGDEKLVVGTTQVAKERDPTALQPHSEGPGDGEATEHFPLRLAA